MPSATAIAQNTCRAATPVSPDRAITEAARYGLTLPAHQSLRLDIISDERGFEGLQAEWDALHRSNQRNQLAFQSHGWIRSWLASYASDHHTSPAMAIITARTNGHLRVVCPLMINHIFGLTCLTWLGEPASQFGDVLSDGTRASQDLIGQVLDHAIARLQPDLVHLCKVRHDAAVRPWLKSQGAMTIGHNEAPFLDFRNAQSPDQYSAKYAAKARKNRRRLRRRLEEAGQVSTTVLPPGEAACEAIRIGLAFKQAWLIERGHVSSVLRDTHMPAFLSDFVSRPNRVAAPFVSIMQCGDTPVSVQFGVLAQRRLALHMIAYNPETEKSGAGVLHIEDTITHCIENGFTELDFLAPDAPYKRAWADASVPVCDYVATRTTRGRLYARGYLSHTRDLLKSRIAALPLGLRQSIARQIQLRAEPRR